MSSSCLSVIVIVAGTVLFISCLNVAQFVLRSLYSCDLLCIGFKSSSRNKTTSQTHENPLVQAMGHFSQQRAKHRNIFLGVQLDDIQDT